MKQKLGAREIALMGLLIALQIVLTRYFVIQTEFFRIGFSFVAVVMMGWIFGPVLAGVGNGIADLFGFLLRPVGLFFPGYTLTAVIEGLVYGWFFHKKELTFSRNVLANLCGSIVSTGLNTLWLWMTLGKTATLAYLPTRLISALVLFVVKVLVVQILAKQTTLVKLANK